MKAPLLPLAVVLSIALPGAAHARAADGRPVRNSFIDRPVGDTRDLVAHVRGDKVVADRYERHFGMDRPTLLRFLGGLHRGRLNRDGVFTIYSVPQGGRLKMHVGRIRRGEAMFFNRWEQPTLVARCGNPVVLGPSHPQKGNPGANPPQEEAKSRDLDLGLSKLAEPAPALALEPSLPATEVAVAATTNYVTPEPAGTDVIPITVTGFDAGSFLVPLGFLAPIVGTRPTEGGLPGKSMPVPEPATMLILAAGAGMFRRRRLLS